MNELARSPERGPKLLFFSGGSALRETARALTELTHRSTHLITPFDSGGSSAELRAAFSMLSVGDLRNRMMALADRSAPGVPEVYRLFRTRLPVSGEVGARSDTLRRRLEAMVLGRDSAVACLPEHLRAPICAHLEAFAADMPADFELRGASVGNLILTGGYLRSGGDIDAVLQTFRELVAVRGLVRPVVDTDLHLCAQLRDGTQVIGQHRITRASLPHTRPPSPIAELRLVDSLREDPRPAQVQIDAVTAALIADADLICFPIGSFWTSVVACLLPGGVGAAIAAAPCPKVFVPNCGLDPESRGLSVGAQVEALLAVMRADAGPRPSTDKLLSAVLIDSRGGAYPEGLAAELVERSEIPIIDAPLTTEHSAPLLDPHRLAARLLALA